MSRPLSPVTIHQQESRYPGQLFTYLGQQAPSTLQLISELEPALLLNSLRSGVALFCSAKAPASILLQVHDLAQQWRTNQRLVLSGFHAPVEQEAFTVLLRGPGSLIYCPARSLSNLRLKPEWRDAVEQGRLSFLSPFPETTRRATQETAQYRNRFIAALADEIWIAYAHPESKTALLVQDVLTWGKRVFTLPHPANGHLLAMGVQVKESAVA